MLRGTCRTLKHTAPSAQKRAFSQNSTRSGRLNLSRSHYAILASSAAVTAGTLWYAEKSSIHSDALPVSPKVPVQAQTAQEAVISGISTKDGSLSSLVWGSNKTHILSPGSQLPESVRTPAVADWLRDVALRDLSVHERHAACVDAKGDVYQWGEGFISSADAGADVSSTGRPVRTLRGKNITDLQTTAERVFALSASGRIYTLSSSMLKQNLPAGVPTPSSTPWWGTGWLWGEEEDVDFVEVTPREKLSRGEKFVSIAAGNDHLLALTSFGRTFAHPISMKANTHGQLGFRKFDVPEHPREPHLHIHRKEVELTPKSIADPYMNASRSVRKPSDQPLTPVQDIVADDSIHFSDKLFEVPALKGVKIDQVAAGARSSFVKTTNGRVLGWGANEFGQIGLGGNVALEAITVPTEVILWRATPQSVRTTCLDVYAGGDLTFFKVERTDGSALPYIDVLACGNGQYGGLGNAAYTTAQGAPVRSRNVSGLLEYSERSNNMQPIYPHNISVSPTGHVLLTLDTLARAGPGGVGRDLLVWGANQEYQLGNGKRGSIASPTALHSPEGHRFMLGKRKADVKDLSGQIWKKGVDVEQYALAGWGNSVVYWRICR